MRLRTTQGRLSPSDLGTVLPHEHVFADLSGEGRHRDVDREAAVDEIAPMLTRAMESGLTALVDATPPGMGRRPDVMIAASDRSGLPVVPATGLPGEPRTPQFARESTEDELVDWLVDELVEGVGETDVPAGWIKLTTSDDGLADVERKAVRAAARASNETGARIGSHTTSAAVLESQFDLLEAEGTDPSQLIWVHTQAESSPERHAELADRGVWLEYDWIGHDDWTDDYYVARIDELVDAGHEQRVLLSHDHVALDPSGLAPDVDAPFTYIGESFVPSLLDSGFDEELIRTLTHDNPVRAYQR